MGAPRHGVNGLIYVGGTELGAANSWSLDISPNTVKTGVFGDVWSGTLKGLLDWSGSINAYDYDDEQTLFDAATSSTSVLIAIYPVRSTLTEYWSGNAVFGMSADGSTSSAVNRNGSFEGDGTLTPTGFDS